MSRLRKFIAKTRYRAKRAVGRFPTLYHWVYRLRDRANERRLVTETTDLCIEGFPRSANSFAVGAFEHAQDESCTIVHHNHVPAPILNAVDRGVPTVVLIRDPVEAVISFRALQLQNGVRSNGGAPLSAVSYRTQLWAWYSFYEMVRPVQNRVVVAPFELVTEDFARVVSAVNDQFGTDFSSFEHTTENVEDVRASHGYHALPTEERDQLKCQARASFHQEYGPNAPVVEEARSMYRRFRSHSPCPPD